MTLNYNDFPRNLIFKGQRPNYVLAAINQMKSIDAWQPTQSASLVPMPRYIRTFELDADQ